MSAKQFLKAAIVRGRIASAWSSLRQRNAFVILSYHSIRGKHSGSSQLVPDSLVHSANDFSAHLQLLKSRFHPVSLDDLLAALRNGDQLPPRSVAVTFDDGFEDNYSVALPLLDDARVPATFFVTSRFIEERKLPWFCVTYLAFQQTQQTGFTDPDTGVSARWTSDQQRREARVLTNRHCARKAGQEQASYLSALLEALNVPEEIADGKHAMMSWSQLREIDASIHTVGAHSASHPNLAHIEPSVLRDEVLRSRSSISVELGTSPRFFAYPNPALSPNWNLGTQKVVADAGFQMAVTSDRGGNTITSDPFQLKRIHSPKSVLDLEWRLEMALAASA